MNYKHAILLSILVHLVLFLGLKVAYYESEKDQPQEKTWLEFKDIESHPMMSDKDRRYKKQTRLKETSPETLSTLSKPENASQNTRPQPQQQQQEASGKGQGKGKGSSLGEFLKNNTTDSGNVFLNQGQNGGGLQSATPQFRQQLRSFLPPEIDVGDMQNLNTDYNVYFTFYERMAQKIVWPWAQHVVAGFEKLRMSNQLGPGSRAWITVIEVLLDEKGSVVSVQPLQLSGFFEIDSAPAKAFKQAKNFPNPPREMLEEDGYIHIRYKFIVYYNPKAGL